MTGNHVSKAHNKVRRVFGLNLQKKRYYLPDQGRWITLRISTRTMRTIDKNGLQAVLDEARRQGVRV
jgi:large subunit ribosomal protein L28